MSAFDLSSGSSFQINDSLEESSMEFVEKRLNSDYMTQTEQRKVTPIAAFVDEQINSQGGITKPPTDINSHDFL